MNEHALKKGRDSMYYVIQVKTGKENETIQDILKNKPDYQSFDVFLHTVKS